MITESTPKAEDQDQYQSFYDMDLDKDNDDNKVISKTKTTVKKIKNLVQPPTRKTSGGILGNRSSVIVGDTMGGSFTARSATNMSMRKAGTKKVVKSN